MMYAATSRNRPTRSQQAGVLAAALFDVDGTLVDTTALIREAVTQVLQEDGITPTWEDLKAGWTLRAADRMRRWARSAEHAGDLADRYERRYLELHDTLVRAYAGMAEALATLAARGIALAVVTSKRRRPALRTLTTFGYDRHFNVIITEDDGLPPKPDPAPLVAATKRLGFAVSAAVMVGDGVVDVQAGAAAEMRTAGALWGTVDADTLRAAGPDWLLVRPADLLTLPWRASTGTDR